MRALFGLLSVLICALIVAYLWASHTAAVSHSGTKAMDQATQLSGHGANGKSALESVKIEPEMDAGGHFKSLVVAEVVPDGAMAKFYGFQKGDKIVSVGDYDVLVNGDASTASAMLLNAYERFQLVEVMRDGKKVQLPLNGSTGKSVQDQFNQLQHVGG